ncbi:hypothetical protein OU997_06240 [Pseudomonas sp. SL4(2022)]|uniref:hypothetical protein n=1 Tax=Pseudomonas sp. SL4(2022) TaxID=2994661 RepID=UPI00226D6C73|nr:hypothetical protein [Pseudomonas sp. SL4(2022)]WAC46745.1 hypothetical protein OU997_06240 [Pseudomonas sp. SL4(2022)]
MEINDVMQQNQNLAQQAVAGMTGSLGSAERGGGTGQPRGELMLQIRSEAQRVVDAIAQFTHAIQD